MSTSLFCLPFTHARSWHSTLVTPLSGNAARFLLSIFKCLGEVHQTLIVPDYKICRTIILTINSENYDRKMFWTPGSTFASCCVCSKTTVEGLVRVKLLWSLGQPLAYRGTLVKRGTCNYCKINWIYFIAWIHVFICTMVANLFRIDISEFKWSFRWDKQLHHSITTISQIQLNTHANPAELGIPMENTNYIWHPMRLSVSTLILIIITITTLFKEGNT